MRKSELLRAIQTEIQHHTLRFWAGLRGPVGQDPQ